jgi:transposase InsO family protein
VIFALVAEAMQAGARPARACAELGVCLRTVQRWRRPGGDNDRRSGPRTRPANALSSAERREVLSTMNSVRYRNLPPKQIVPELADRGRYLASESTMYRLLRSEGQLAHRGRARPPTRHEVKEHAATAPNQVWSWDITYLKCALKGSFYYLYMVEDVWSRKIVGWAIHVEESMDLAAQLMREICMKTSVDVDGLVLHSDNGGPMKGSTMLATLQRLGVVPSFSRPGVSDDNPFSEALFRTMKYRPGYPRKPFATLEQARAWVAGFVAWYNSSHRHSGIRFVTPDERHSGSDVAILARRAALYEQARGRHPERWSRSTRNWTPVGAVYLNPQQREVIDAHVAQLAS